MLFSSIVVLLSKSCSSETVGLNCMYAYPWTIRYDSRIGNKKKADLTGLVIVYSVLRN